MINRTNKYCQDLHFGLGILGQGYCLTYPIAFYVGSRDANVVTSAHNIVLVIFIHVA